MASASGLLRSDGDPAERARTLRRLALGGLVGTSVLMAALSVVDRCVRPRCLNLGVPALRRSRCVGETLLGACVSECTGEWARAGAVLMPAQPYTWAGSHIGLVGPSPDTSTDSPARRAYHRAETAPVEIDAVNSAIALGVLWSCAIAGGVFGLRSFPRARRARAAGAAAPSAAAAESAGSGDGSAATAAESAPEGATAAPAAAVAVSCDQAAVTTASPPPPALASQAAASFDDVLRLCVVFQAAVPVAYFGLLWAGGLSPCYLTHAVMLAVTAYAQLLTAEATAGWHGRPWVAVVPLVAAVPLLVVPSALAPGAWAVHLPSALAHALTGRPHPVRVTTHTRHAAAPVYTAVDFLARSFSLYARRDVWPPGPWGAAAWRWHWWGLRVYLALLTAAFHASVSDVRKRITEPSMRAVLAGMQAVTTVSPMVAWWALSPAAPSPGMRLLFAFWVYLVRYLFLPLAMATMLDAAREEERALAARLDDAERAQREAESACCQVVVGRWLVATATQEQQLSLHAPASTTYAYTHPPPPRTRSHCRHAARVPAVHGARAASARADAGAGRGGAPSGTAGRRRGRR